MMNNISKKLRVFGLVTLVFIFLLAGEANSARIGNGALEGDVKPCTPMNHAACGQQQANQYQRGCEKGKDCRSFPKEKNQITSLTRV
ncbi:conserved hypothetical protein [Ricinus communis]|uniref:RALFL33 n=1 Tax=Ricinus communis TaxID=3988 RepID=B9SSB1_RICCO|nr:conserved hypothetical protein [Ricinus communis]